MPAALGAVCEAGAVCGGAICASAVPVEARALGAVGAVGGLDAVPGGDAPASDAAATGVPATAELAVTVGFG
jgi:hypothetical protein